VKSCKARGSGIKYICEQTLLLLSCCISQSSFIWWTLFSRWRFTFFRFSASGGRTRSCAKLLLAQKWTFPHLGIVIKTQSIRMYIFMCIRFLLGLSVASLCSPHGFNPAWQESPNVLVILWTSPSERTYSRPKQQHSKFWLITNFRLNYHLLPRKTKHESLAVKMWAS